MGCPRSAVAASVIWGNHAPGEVSIVGLHEFHSGDGAEWSESKDMALDISSGVSECDCYMWLSMLHTFSVQIESASVTDSDLKR